MATRLDSVVVDSADAQRQARWWAAALGWRVVQDGPDESTVEPAEGEPGVELVFAPVPESKTVKNRVHLDLRSESVEHQEAQVERLLAAGATRADVGQPTQGPDAVPFVVLADPEGNEFCVLDPRPHYDESCGAVAALVLDAAAPAELARFWAAATGWRVTAGNDRFASLRSPDGRGPFLELIRDATLRTVKNRVHLDVRRAAGDDQRAEVARLCDAGARPAEIGQSVATPGTVTWVVLTDPEGNEVCVLSPG
jgi:predicted enzyme related to lactoylglutathione lyase